MPEFRRILCPVDFSETSKQAFEYALALATRLGAEVDVIHVYHPEDCIMADKETKKEEQVQHYRYPHTFQRVSKQVP